MKKPALFLLLFWFGCTYKPKDIAVHITMINNGRSIKFNGLDYAIISEINRDSMPGIWKNLIPVFRMPADTDLKNYQPIQPGLYQLKDSAVVFTPDTPFVNSQTYFVRYFEFTKGSSIMDFIKGKRKPGSINFIDLIFKK